MKQAVLLDAVDLGITESEEHHRPFGNFALKIPGKRNLYRGPANVVNNRDLSHFREAPRTNALHLAVPGRYVGADLEIEISLRCYAHGDVGAPPEPTIVQVMGKTRWVQVGEVTVPLDDRFHAYRFKVPGGIVQSGGIMVWLDDTMSHFAEDTHYGKAIGYVRLYGDPAASKRSGPAAEAKGTPPDIVLVMCPVWDVLMPPIALASLASHLSANGVHVAVHDFNIEAYHAAAQDERGMWEGSNAVAWSEMDYGHRMLARHEHLVQAAADKILAYGSTFVGFSVATVNATFSMRLAEVLKERRPDVKIVFGGSGIPFFEDGQLGPHWDYLVYGAGEVPILSIVRDGASGVLGVTTRDNPEPYDPGRNRSFLTELDPLALVHYEHFDLLQYIHPWRLPVLTSRGCINACKYCYDTVFYGPYACLSGERAFEQLKLLHEKHGRRVFEFADLLCNGDLDELRVMCERIVESGLRIDWGSFAVMRPGMTPELMRLMASAGCKYLHYGFETGSAKMLKRMGRDYTVGDARDSLRNTKEAGIRTKINIMVGFPGETDRTIAETVDFIRGNAAFIDIVETVNPVYVMASTDLSANQEKYGIEVPDGIPDHWQAGAVTEDKRRGWVYSVIDAVKAAGITCNYSVMRGFACQAADESDYR